jgi:hypothetical protein
LSALDKQEGGSHYKNMAIQPLEFIHANDVPFIEANIIKYILRHKTKNKKQDVLKAIHYCELLLELEYAEKKKNNCRAGS